MEPYVLLGHAARDSVVEGRIFPTLRRTRWRIDLRVVQLVTGGSVTLQLQGAPWASIDNSDWTVLDDFGGAKVTTGLTTIYSYARGETAADFTLDEGVLQVRAVVTASTGQYILECLATSRFMDLDVEAHVELMPAALADTRTRQRLIDDAEREVVRFLKEGECDGYLNVNPQDTEVSDLIREAIVLHAVWVQQREQWAASGNRDDRKMARVMRGIAPDARDRLRPIVRWTDRLFLHR